MRISGTDDSSPSLTFCAPSTVRTMSATSEAIKRSVSISSPRTFTEMPVPVSIDMSIVLVWTVRSSFISSAIARISRAMSTLSRPALESTMI